MRLVGRIRMDLSSRLMNALASWNTIDCWKLMRRGLLLAALFGHAAISELNKAGTILRPFESAKGSFWRKEVIHRKRWRSSYPWTKLGWRPGFERRATRL